MRGWGVELRHQIYLNLFRKYFHLGLFCQISTSLARPVKLDQVLDWLMYIFMLHTGMQCIIKMVTKSINHVPIHMLTTDSGKIFPAWRTEQEPGSVLRLVHGGGVSGLREYVWRRGRSRRCGLVFYLFPCQPPLFLLVYLCGSLWCRVGCRLYVSKNLSLRWWIQRWCLTPVA